MTGKKNSKKTEEVTSRREFIERTLKMTAGAYMGMSVLDSFRAPKLGTEGMPLYAASGRTVHPRLNRKVDKWDGREWDGDGAPTLDERARRRRNRRGDGDG